MKVLKRKFHDFPRDFPQLSNLKLQLGVEKKRV